MYKYRAWDLRGDIMLTNLDSVTLNQLECGVVTEYEDEDEILTIPVEFMQHTGLRDKNGGDIFIGDILKLDLLAGDIFSEVKVCLLREIPVVHYFQDHGWEPLHAYVGKPDTCLEVVGNIYQHPELVN